jgi:hypothetical protein
LMVMIGCRIVLPRSLAEIAEPQLSQRSLRRRRIFLVLDQSAPVAAPFFSSA